MENKSFINSPEEKLKKSENFLSEIINTIADPVFVKDDQFKFVLINDALCDIVGEKHKNLIGKTGAPLTAFTGEGKVKIHGEIWNAVSEDDIEVHDEIVVTGVNGMNLLVKKSEE